MSANTRPINPFPPRWVGLWRVKAVPYYFKDTWREAPFGNRWRALKAKLRAPSLPASAVAP